MANSTRTARVKCRTGNATLAQVKAGHLILAPFGGAYVITGGWMRCLGGDAAGATSINISDTAGTPVVAVAVAVAPLDDGVIVTFDDASNVTRTTFGVALTVGKGVQIIDAGSDLTTCETVDYCVEYVALS